MTQGVIEAVKKARELFHIKDFPGNLFVLLEEEAVETITWQGE